VLQPANTPLSDRGIAQAQALAERLSRLPLAAILSSDMPRAMMTAEPLAQSTGLPIVTSQLLHERNFGDLRGQAYDDLDLDPMAPGYQPPAGESWETFGARVVQAFQQVVSLRASTPGTLVVVSHGLVIKAMLQAHLRLAAGEQAPERMANTSVTIVDATAPHAVRLMNCDAHLHGAIADDARALSGF
ncbi:MAG: histidine phosphatase family protein, partial [Quisquiliibacterium sp.]